MTANNVAICLRELGASVPAPAQPAAEATEAPVVALKGLVGAAQHNGQRASVLNFAADRFTVQLEADGTQLSVKPANIEVAVVPVGLAVGVGGLVGAAEHNGKRGAVASGPDLTTGRYSVKLEEGGKPLGLKPANLRLLEGMAADEPSQGPGPPPELEPEPEPEPELEPKPEALEFAGLAWPTGEPVGSLASFLTGPPGSQAGLPEYAAALAGLAPAELAEDRAVAAAGVRKVFHRKRICKWAASLVAA